jgi:protein O-mannosyl-transferase
LRIRQSEFNNNSMNKKIPEKRTRPDPQGVKNGTKPGGFFRNKNVSLVLLGLIGLFTFIVYARAISYGFIYNWDDAGYILKNEYLKEFTFSNIADIFSSFYMHNYHPLTTLTYLIEYTLVGENAWLYHLNNILLHIANTFLVFILIRKLLKGSEIPALFVAALFALHPMHVESVAWISERKDVLYAFFFLLALIRYVRYLESGKKIEFLYTSILFLLSCLSKSAAVTLPVLLFAFDYVWRRKFTLWSVLEKVPLILISLVFGILAIKSQDTAIQDLTPLLSIFERILIVCWAICLYLYKAIVPAGLSAFYPYPLKYGDILPWFYFVAPFIVAGLAVFLWYSRKWGREVMFGFAFFFITISLVLQLMPVGGAIIAERYTYVPYIGLFFVLALPLRTFSSTPGKAAGNYITNYGLVMLFAVFAFAYLTYDRVGYWKDGDVLFSDVLKKYPKFPYGYNNRGFLYFDYYALKVYPENEVKKKAYTEKALADYTMAIQLDPNYVQAYSNRAVLLYNTGRPEAALNDFNVLLTLSPDHTDGLIGRANTLSTLEKYEEAIPDYNAYLLKKKDDVKAWLWRGIAFSKTGENELAISDFDMTIQLDPEDFEGYYWKAIALHQMKQYEESVQYFDKAVSKQPVHYELYSWRGLAHYALKEYEKSVLDYNKAIELMPGELSTYINRSVSLNELGRYEEAFNDLIYAAEKGYPINRGYYESLLMKVRRR